MTPLATIILLGNAVMWCFILVQHLLHKAEMRRSEEAFQAKKAEFERNQQIHEQLLALRNTQTQAEISRIQHEIEQNQALCDGLKQQVRISARFRN